MRISNVNLSYQRGHSPVFTKFDPAKSCNIPAKNYLTRSFLQVPSYIGLNVLVEIRKVEALYYWCLFKSFVVFTILFSPYNLLQSLSLFFDSCFQSFSVFSDLLKYCFAFPAQPFKNDFSGLDNKKISNLLPTSTVWKRKK